ncbi:PRTRC system ParB family protein [Piscinibacter gummiphilus]|uniref:PRTRC system ParB family protein n=1 Tax=Piscinibacter gummiphilus TaxID=946333 RepID=A0ABZ0D6U6_9BURK|nr:PRTRC system ParB family protein [Piscinibacter gummiphilus]WOB11246.1 PRTRC system ParB family protein [Piscinibacter gummiphilus]
MKQPTLKLGLIIRGNNYRERITEESMLEMAEAIKAAGGVIEPVIVREHPTRPGYYELIAGERRCVGAHHLYGDDYDMPVVVREATDAEAKALSIIENAEREDPTEIEEAQGAADLLAFNNGDKAKTAAQLGWRDPKKLDRRLLLLGCTAKVRQALIEKKIYVGHAELLSGLDPEWQDKVLPQVIEHKVSVEVLKKQLGQFSKSLADAIFDTAICVGCPHNSAQQSGLFDASIGDGRCQKPSHFEELTLAAVQKIARPLEEKYQVVRIYKNGDGFIPLHLQAEGEVGVGPEQYESCKGCANFGCSVSAVPGSYGAVAESLCFDAQCHSTKVAERRKAERAAKASASENPQATGSKQQAASQKGQEAKRKATNQTPPRVVQYRLGLWREWAQIALMADADKAMRVLISILASSSTSHLDSGKFVAAAVEIAKPAPFGSNLFKSAVEQASRVDAGKLPNLIQAMASSAAHGAPTQDLELMLTYLEVEEASHFRLNEEFLELMTMSELESLADEVKLRKAMGDAAFKKARSGAKPAFIKALLSVQGFDYAGVVPKCMRYSRKPLKLAAAGVAKSETADQQESQPQEAPV